MPLPDSTMVFDVLIDVIRPVSAKAGQVLVVRGGSELSVLIVRKGTTHVVGEATLHPSEFVPLVAQGVLQRRARNKV